MKDIKQIIAENILALRKEHQLTQNDLAQKLNYSDNTVSRWEKAEVTPGVETLVQISEVFDVPLETLLHENAIVEIEEDAKINKLKKLATILLCVSLVWFSATIAYFYLETFFNKNQWTIFVWAVPVSCLVLLAFNQYVKSRLYSFIFCSICIWSTILSIYLEFIEYNMFLIFLIGAPAQLALTIYNFVRPKSEQNEKRIVKNDKKESDNEQ